MENLNAKYHDSKETIIINDDDVFISKISNNIKKLTKLDKKDLEINENPMKIQEKRTIQINTLRKKKRNIPKYSNKIINYPINDLYLGNFL